MRRIVASAIVAVAGMAGSFAFMATAAHADAGACLTAHVNVNGSDLVNQTNCLP
jgi:hypothetical protein